MIEARYGDDEWSVMGSLGAFQTEGEALRVIDRWTVDSVDLRAARYVKHGDDDD